MMDIEKTLNDIFAMKSDLRDRRRKPVLILVHPEFQIACMKWASPIAYKPATYNSKEKDRLFDMVMIARPQFSEWCILCLDELFDIPIGGMVDYSPDALLKELALKD